MTNLYDPLDLSILREMRSNAKQSYRELASKLKVHPNTLMQRLKRLEREKIIRNYSVDIDYRKIGYDMHAVALVRVKKGRIGDVNQLKEICQIPQIEGVYAITGVYDVLILLRGRDRDELAQVLRKIGEHPAILRSNTITVLYTYKRPDEFNPL